MRLKLLMAAMCAAAGALVAVQASAQSGDVAVGDRVYKARCAGCHDTGAGEAPAKELLAVLPLEEIVHALKDGRMMTMASGLSEDEIKGVAAYLVASRAGPPAVAAPPASTGAPER